MPGSHLLEVAMAVSGILILLLIVIGLAALGNILWNAKTWGIILTHSANQKTMIALLTDIRDRVRHLSMTCPASPEPVSDSELGSFAPDVAEPHSLAVVGYRIIGADRETGADVDKVLDEVTEEGARALAHKMGVLVQGIEPVTVSVDELADSGGT